MWLISWLFNVWDPFSHETERTGEKKKELHPSSASWASVSCILLCCLQGSMLSINKHPICMWLSLVYLAPSIWFSVPSHQEYSIDIIFYQSWYDERLRYNDSFETLVLHGNVVKQLWIPDTYFRNSKRTREFDVTMPNQMALIHKDGKVLYSVSFLWQAWDDLQVGEFQAWNQCERMEATRLWFYRNVQQNWSHLHPSWWSECGAKKSSQGSSESNPGPSSHVLTRMWMDQVTQPAFCHGKHLALLLCVDTKSAFATTLLVTGWGKLTLTQLKLRLHSTRQGMDTALQMLFLFHGELWERKPLCFFGLWDPCSSTR